MSEMINARKEYIEHIREELLGPGSEELTNDFEHEIITERPESRYSSGILYPINSKVIYSSDDTVDMDGDAQNELGDEIPEINPDVNYELSVKREEPNNQQDYETILGEDNSESAVSIGDEVSMAAQNKPSSMGMIFFAKGNVDSIVCNVKFATYKDVSLTDCKVMYKPTNLDVFEVPRELRDYVIFDKEQDCLRLNVKNPDCKNFSAKKCRDILEHIDISSYDPKFKQALYGLAGQYDHAYIRCPHESRVVVTFDSDYSDNNKNIENEDIKVTALRRRVEDDRYAISLMLVNESKEEHIFQSVLSVSSEDNRFIFCEYSNSLTMSTSSDEEISMDMQYRKKKKYATGMGVATDWCVDNNGRGSIWTEYIPVAEIPQMDFNIPSEYGVDTTVLGMKYLSDLNEVGKEEKINLLKQFVFAYKKWINNLSVLAGEDSEIKEKYSEIAQKNIDGCEKSYSRMLAGIATLENDPLAWSAFELANRAMFMQRAHLKIQEAYKECDLDDEKKIDFLQNIDYYNIDEKIKDRYSWRPFQLAFILLSINSIVKEDSSDGDIVDLIWFPTGGGKTEAYLGLTAFTIFFRRLHYPEQSKGTAVMMRYTLRLLTSQQFTRASTLICACEVIRQDSCSKRANYKKYSLGEEKITIGLWIGGEHTPNHNSMADENLKKLKKATNNTLSNNMARYNKFQVLKCPWCGGSLVKHQKENKLVGEWGYAMHRGHFVLKCNQDGCHFYSESTLPIQVVDDELYDAPPTLLFGTVDKFAMLPWNPRIGSFFGIGKEQRAPELIIQDELHLISGPLGTMVGLYETIIDKLCSLKNRTKIIASTATIKGAESQCSSLYNREVMQFPHPGLDADDSFFAKEKEVNYEKGQYGRVYVGISAPGKSKAMAEDRIISSLMQRIHMMDISDPVKDKYWTLTTYFNSLKELGKCSVLMQDEVSEYIEKMAKRHNTSNRWLNNASELTSRVSTTYLNETMEKLQKVSYDSNKKGNGYPIDAVLATNMISVGIDIARLNVMHMVSQPKLTSEYIQATSRVGREFPGVVFVQYDGYRSRDKSHYEQFRSYHSSFYKYVEPTGVTPFAKPARERALASIVVALMRNMVAELNKEKDAGNFDSGKYASEISEIKQYICERNNGINSRMPVEVQDETENIENEIDKIVNDWKWFANDYGEDLVYGEKNMNPYARNNQDTVLKTYDDEQTHAAFKSMTSMRNVDKQLEGTVLIWEEDY